MTPVKYFKQAIILLWVIGVTFAWSSRPRCTSLVAYSYRRGLQYPLSSTYYGNNVDVCWIIQASSSNRRDHVQLTFSTLDLLPSTSCTSDYVRVRDGSSSSSSVIGTYCGYTVPQSMVSSGNSLYVQFRSVYNINRGSHRGFHAIFQTITSPACNSLTAFSSSLTLRYYASPSWNGNNRDICWIITRSSSTGTDHVMLTFSTFNMGVSTTCNFNYVQVRDGRSSSSSSIGIFCGSTVPQRTMISSSSSLFIQFRSDGSSINRGFQLSYRRISESDSDFHFYRNGGGSHSSSVACVGALIMILAVIVWLNIRTKDWEENKCRSDSKSRRAELG